MFTNEKWVFESSNYDGFTCKLQFPNKQVE